MSQARGVVHYSSFFGLESPWAILSAIIYFRLPLLQLMEMASAENSASETVAQTLGWNLYDSAAEYYRMGIPNNLWKHIKLNLSYEVQLTGMKINTYFMFFTNRCDESSRSVLYVPSSMETSTIQGCAKFWSKGRLPVLSY